MNGGNMKFKSFTYAMLFISLLFTCAMFPDTASAITYTISGTVTFSGSGLKDVTMTLSGDASAATTTSNSGVYSFSALSNGNYTVTPSKTGYTFDPPSINVTIHNAPQTGVDFTANRATYSISGSVIGDVQEGVTITLSVSGVSILTTITDVFGSYSFTGLTNGFYTVTPSKFGYAFNPPSSMVPIFNGDPPDVNFTSSLVTSSISGTVSGDVKEGVTITLSGDASLTTTTNALGSYNFSGLINGTYIITPSKTGYAFTPPSRNVTLSGVNQTGQDFVATVAGIYSISGIVTLSGAGLSNVTMTLSGTASKTTATDSSGNYSFTGLINGNYTITPSKPSYAFTPPSLSVDIQDVSVVGKDFTASSTAIYSISGKVTGDIQEGVTITLSVTPSNVTTTDSSGNYSFTGLTNGDYLVTPTKIGYTFSPLFASVSIRNNSQTNINFTASVEGTYFISGTVTLNGSGLSGVTMTLSGDASQTKQTDSDGYYSFSGLSNGTFTITPSKTGYSFNPASRSIDIAGSSVTGADFTASQLPTYSIAGTVALGSGNPLTGVTITLSGDASLTTTTNASGNYSFTDLSNGTYTITPSKSSYAFTPPSTTVTIIDASVSGIEFIASEACATWRDVIAAYNEYVAGSKTWLDVISTYKQYVTQPCP
jgi:hypothetical protein